MKNYQRLILSVLSALFLFLSFREMGFFAWFSLIPFLFVIYKSNLKQTLFFSFICGIGFFAGVTYWMSVLPVKYAWLFLVPLLSIIFLVYGIAIYSIFQKINQPYIRIFLVPAVWIIAEYLRSQSLLAFTIGILGYSQHYFLPLMQIARFTGIYGVSFIIILFNTCIFETIVVFIKNKRAIFGYLIISISILIIFITYGILSVNSNLDRVIKTRGYNEIKVSVVQPNVSYEDKYSEDGIEIIPEPYSKSIFFKEGTELVVFPESMLWGFIDNNKNFKNRIREVTEKEDVNILIGQYVQNEDYTEYYNSALLYSPHLEVAGRYDEVHPVPFSQYVPYPKILGFLKFLDFSIVNLVPSEDYSPINYPGKGKLGINICYESTIPSIARNIRNNGAEVIFVLADNSSFDESIAPWHHLIFSKVRAIENGCYVIHCANRGMSAIISPSGEIIERSEILEKKVLYGSVFLIPEKTFYSKFGDVLIFIYPGVIFFTAFLYLIREKIKKTTPRKK